MAQQTSSAAMRGGLNLTDPPILLRPGACTAALNYEPDDAGYRRIDGYERYDGRPSPSGETVPAAIETRRLAIGAVPGEGPVRGVHVYGDDLYAFRDKPAAAGAGVYKATAAGWEEIPVDSFVATFVDGTAEFTEGAVLAGVTSAATGRIERIVQRAGAFGQGDASGYLVLSSVAGTFQANETITDGEGGSAEITTINMVALESGGRYDFTNHNFYGGGYSIRMYGVNGTSNAFEFNGQYFAPIVTGHEVSPDQLEHLFNMDGEEIFDVDGVTPIYMPAGLDTPTHVGKFHNHLMLGFRTGAIVNSSIGEPLDYRPITGAGTMNLGEPVTNFAESAATAFVVFGQNRVEYLTGTDSSTFQMNTISDAAGGYPWTAIVGGENPIYFDDAGVRRLTTTAAFGDWNAGTLTQKIRPLLRRLKNAGILPVMGMRVRDREQYRLFFNDGTGLIVAFNRDPVEVMPFKVDFQAFSGGVGELGGLGIERMFVGAEDGFVYEINAGTSYDGAAVPAFVRLSWTNMGAPRQEKRYHKATIEMDAPEAVEIGIAFDVDYAIQGNNTHGDPTDIEVPAGSQTNIPIADYASIDWTQAMQGLLERYIDGIGFNIALTLVSEHTYEAPHTFASASIAFSPRRQLR